jgi:hypothetical protein
MALPSPQIKYEMNYSSIKSGAQRMSRLNLGFYAGCGVPKCLAELKRNEPLRRLISIESEERVPSKWNLSRLEETLTGMSSM